MNKETVVCYIEQDNKYLMMLRNKKINDYNGGKFIGVGGKLEIGETKEQALLREIKEETNLNLIDYKYKGKVLFVDKLNNGVYQEIMYVYTSDNFSGDLTECDEGTFYWIEKNKILDLPLWEGDKYFLKELDKQTEFDIELRYVNSVFVECIKRS